MSRFLELKAQGLQSFRRGYPTPELNADGELVVRSQYVNWDNPSNPTLEIIEAPAGTFPTFMDPPPPPEPRPTIPTYNTSPPVGRAYRSPLRGRCRNLIPTERSPTAEEKEWAYQTELNERMAWESSMRRAGLNPDGTPWIDPMTLTPDFTQENQRSSLTPTMAIVALFFLFAGLVGSQVMTFLFIRFGILSLNHRGIDQLLTMFYFIVGGVVAASATAVFVFLDPMAKIMAYLRERTVIFQTFYAIMDEFTLLKWDTIGTLRHWHDIRFYLSPPAAMFCISIGGLTEHYAEGYIAAVFAFVLMNSNWLSPVESVFTRLSEQSTASPDSTATRHNTAPSMQGASSHNTPVPTTPSHARSARYTSASGNASTRNSTPNDATPARNTPPWASPSTTNSTPCPVRPAGNITILGSASIANSTPSRNVEDNTAYLRDLDRRISELKTSNAASRQTFQERMSDLQRSTGGSIFNDLTQPTNRNSPDTLSNTPVSRGWGTPLRQPHVKPKSIPYNRYTHCTRDSDKRDPTNLGTLNNKPFPNTSRKSAPRKIFT